MQCPRCKTDNREGAKFCLSCGARLAFRCQQCGAELPADARFCDARCTPAAVTPTSPQEAPSATALIQTLERLVPREYAERLRAAGGHVQGERRLVTILFCDVNGSTAMAENLDPEDVMEVMNGAFQVMVGPVFRYEGTLARLMGDAILARFGAPIAHEDDAERASRGRSGHPAVVGFALFLACGSCRGAIAASARDYVAPGARHWRFWVQRGPGAL